VVVLGDFNAGEDNPAFLQLMENGDVPLRDSFRLLHPEAKSVGTFNGFAGRTEGPKIDAVLVSPNLQIISAEIIQTNEEGRYPSDHFPVTAEIKFKK
jgi:endonuclease/exonuclease/phosphatase family metal-dependent hydrolase